MISTRGTDLEMTPLDQDDDEDDSTLFDVQHRYYSCLQVAVTVGHVIIFVLSRLQR